MQDMLAATMMLGTTKRRIRDNPDASAALEKVQQKLIQAGTDLRQLSHDLHPPLLQEAGLPKAVQTYCEEFSAASTIPVSCEVDETASELSRGSALTLFRILQEALGNAAKHAQAGRVTVRLMRENGSVTLAVSDNGVGLNRSALSTGSGLGLVMMRERAIQLNGRFDFDSALGRGTTVKVTIPFR
jgi:signal transduction histidine kinase